MAIFKHPIKAFNDAIAQSGKILDIGALDFSQYHRVKETHPKLEHYGIDYMQPTTPLPDGYDFKLADLNKGGIPYDDDFFDYIVASHVIEHLDNPIDFFRECLRVLKPGGKFYVEAPSEKSLMINGMNFDYDGFYALNMYDDPTHVRRPWTPNSYWRLARYYGAKPIEVGYVRSNWARLLAPILIPYARLTKNGYLLQKVIWFANGWASYGIITKTQKGNPTFTYSIPTKEERTNAK